MIVKEILLYQSAPLVLLISWTELGEQSVYLDLQSAAFSPPEHLQIKVGEKGVCQKQQKNNNDNPDLVLLRNNTSKYQSNF